MFGDSATGGGKRARRRASKRERILAAARERLLAVGVEALSLRDVARCARVSPAGMYEFFDSKAHLIEELAWRANQSLLRALVAARRQAGTDAERLVAMALAYVRFARRHPEDFRLLFGRGIQKRRSLAMDVPPESPYGLLRAGVAGVVHPARLEQDPRALEALTFGLWSMVHGMATLRLTALAGFRADFEAGQAMVLRSLVEGLRRPPEPGEAP